MSNPFSRNITDKIELPPFQKCDDPKIQRVIQTALNLLSEEGINSKKLTKEYLEALLNDETLIDIDSLGTEEQHIKNHFKK